MNRLQRVQNAAARMVSGTRRHEHITPVLRDLHWLPVLQRIKFKILILVFKCVHQFAPPYLVELIHQHVPRRSLRSAEKDLLTVPYTNSDMCRTRAFSIAGPVLWNALPQQLRAIDNLNSFKSALKTYLFAEHFY